MTDLLLAALLASLPLALTGLIPWWATALYSLPLGLQIQRGRGGTPPPFLDERMMNMLSLGCLGLFILDMLFLSHSMIRVAVHLSLSLIVLLACHLRTGRDRSWFALLVFFLSVAGAANSTHPALAIHLLVLLALFASWMLQAMGLPPRTARRMATLQAAACLLIAGPLFLLMPRLRGPYVPGGRAHAGEARTFSLESMGIEGMAGSRNDRRIALRVRFEGGPVVEETLRLRARTFSDFRRGQWSNPSVRYRLRRFRADGRLWFDGGEGAGRRYMEAFPKDLSAQYLPIPYTAAGLEAALTYAHIGDDGTVRLSPAVAQRQFKYRAFMDPAPAPLKREERESDLALPPGMERELRDLAERIFRGDPSPEAGAGLLRFFASGFIYAMEDYNGTENPLREFLFKRRRGHCELYATAGAMLLRAGGIPARVAVGFLGGERNPLQNYYVVRFSNAHAWVEAWIGDRWVVIDPTPPESRPALESGKMSGQAAFFWETVSFFWDRHVIGFAFADQADLARFMVVRAGPVLKVSVWGIAALGLVAAGIAASAGLRSEPAVIRRYRRIRKRMAFILEATEESLAPEAIERAVVGLDPSVKNDAESFFRAYRSASFGDDRRSDGQGGRVRTYRRLRNALRRWKKRN